MNKPKTRNNKKKLKWSLIKSLIFLRNNFRKTQIVIIQNSPNFSNKDKSVRKLSSMTKRRIIFRLKNDYLTKLSDQLCLYNINHFAFRIIKSSF